MREKIRRCAYCRREVKASGMSWSENPFCDACFAERVAEANKRIGPVARYEVGCYVGVTPTNEKAA